MDCNYTIALSQAQPYTLQIRTQLSSTAGTPTTLQWSYVKCSSAQFAQLSGNDTVQCASCPAGGDCTGGGVSADALLAASGLAVVTQQTIVAQPGYWASSATADAVFYKCPLAAACLPGVNGSRSVCAEGYSDLLCSVCAKGYFQQYGLCAKCPDGQSAASVLASFGLPLLLLVIFVVLFVLRAMAPRGMMKVGISMMQIIASANSVYNVPWPTSFSDFLDVMKV